MRGKVKGLKDVLLHAGGINMADNKQREKLKKEALAFHKNNFPGNGKIEIIPKVSLKTRHDLSLAYTPGVAEPCREIAKNPE